MRGAGLKSPTKLRGPHGPLTCRRQPPKFQASGAHLDQSCREYWPVCDAQARGKANRTLPISTFRVTESIGLYGRISPNGRTCSGLEIGHGKLASARDPTSPSMFVDVNTGLFCRNGSGNRGPICWHSNTPKEEPK
jgi:hypothetical protein